MPQISPMNWMMIFSFFIYMIMYLKKKLMNEKLISLKIYFYKMEYVK